MTECRAGTLVFSSLNRRKIVADFNGEQLTSDGGAPLLREANRRTGLIDAMAACIADPRDPSRIQHDVKTLPAQRVFGIAMGYEDGNDHQTLRSVPIMQVLADLPPDAADPLASLPTLCRLENWRTCSSSICDAKACGTRSWPRRASTRFD